MDNRQLRTMQAYEAVLAYMRLTPVRPAPPLWAAMEKRLAAGVRRIKALYEEQEKTTRTGKAYVEHKRQKLRRERMMPLVRVATPLVKWARGAGALRVPHARADAQTVAKAALELADVLAPHARLLRAAGCDKNFVTDLRRDARDLATSRMRAEKARARVSVVTARLAEEFRKGSETLHIIEGLVLLHQGRDRAMVEYWRKTRRVSARMGRPRVKKGQGSGAAVPAVG